ncbi:uncharacterized protein [Drosophila kikkawai]|uniref:Uncharacterized protein LOC108083115 n=1 Tax=Drosophila kikkawai TaxID=30033 RepID=A0A6P4IYU0_DROKI|nr:uncharacterized protein LOC108083115 [Drosophila kikkawai]
MWKLVFLVLITLEHSKGNDLTKEELEWSQISNTCGDCSAKEFPKKFTTTGYSCDAKDNNAIESSTEAESGYPQCVPKSYAVVVPVHQYCCFWSPELGCTILVGQKQYVTDQLKCTNCLEPCTRAATNSGVRHTNYGILALAVPILAKLL